MRGEAGGGEEAVVAEKTTALVGEPAEGVRMQDLSGERGRALW